MNRSGFNFISDYDFFETIHLNKRIHNKGDCIEIISFCTQKINF